MTKQGINLNPTGLGPSFGITLILSLPEGVLISKYLYYLRRKHKHLEKCVLFFHHVTEAKIPLSLSLSLSRPQTMKLVASFAAVCCAIVSMADAFVPSASFRPTGVGGRKTSAVKFRTTMQLGGGGLDNLGGDRGTYLDRVQQLKQEISSGTRTADLSKVDPRMITENEEVMFETINSPLKEEEVTRLTEASGKRENDVDQEEEDAELEAELLAMFVDQGDIDESILPVVGSTTAKSKRTVIELPEPLDIGASQDLLRAFNQYSDIEKDIWQDVGEELVRGVAPEPNAEFPETFVLKPQGGNLDVLQ